MSRISKSEKARRLLQATPTLTALALSEKMGISRNYAYKLMYNLKNEVKVEDVIEEKAPQEGEMLSKLIYDVSQRRAKIRMMQGGEEKETVNHPPHYKVGGIETIDFIEAKKLNYNLGNVVKYLTRADHKGSKLEDLRKAQWYLTREINSTK
jgi:hypothetical protein